MCDSFLGKIVLESYCQLNAFEAVLCWVIAITITAFYVCIAWEELHRDRG